MKSLLIGLLAVSLTGCTGMFRPPKGTYEIPLDEAPAIGAGRIRPVGIGPGELEVDTDWGGPSPIGQNRWVIDVGEYSRFFADRLREEYSRRGVDVSGGPEMTVEVRRFSWAKERYDWFKTRRRSRTIADVQVGNRKWTFDVRTELDQDGKVKISSSYNLIREILRNEEILAVIRAETEEPALR